jgi:hypothetical protein
MVGTPLGMANNNRVRSSISEHLRGNIAGVGARWFGVTVLCANEHRRATRGSGKCRYQGGWRANHEFRLAGKILRVGDDPGELSFGRRQSIHLPIARDERNYFGWRHPNTLSCVPLSDPLSQSQQFGLGSILLELQGVGPVTMVRAARLG